MGVSPGWNELDGVGQQVVGPHSPATRSSSGGLGPKHDDGHIGDLSHRARHLLNGVVGHHEVQYHHPSRWAAVSASWPVRATNTA